MFYSTPSTARPFEDTFRRRLCVALHFREPLPAQAPVVPEPRHQQHPGHRKSRGTPPLSFFSQHRELSFVNYFSPCAQLLESLKKLGHATADSSLPMHSGILPRERRMVAFFMTEILVISDWEQSFVDATRKFGKTAVLVGLLLPLVNKYFEAIRPPLK